LIGHTLRSYYLLKLKERQKER